MSSASRRTGSTSPSEASRLLRASLERFERALASRSGKFTVSEAARGWGRGRGYGREAGVELHGRYWGDPGFVLESEVAAVPLPLAWRFRFGWVYGVADQVLFRRGWPVEVAELKSYDRVGLYERVQASLYGLLVELNWGVRPAVRVVGRSASFVVEGWEELAVEALERLVSRNKYVPGNA